MKASPAMPSPLVVRSAVLCSLFLAWGNAWFGPTCLAEEARRLLLADSSKKRIAIVGEQGSLEWEMKIGPLHDLHLLPNGHILMQEGWTKIVEVDPATKEVVWSYDAGKGHGNEGRRIEVHAFQRLPDGKTMIAESGSSRILEIDPQGNVTHEVKLQVKQPHPHRDTRLVRQLDNGHYLVCHEGDGRVCEYDRAGKVVWDYDVPLFGKSPANGHGPEGFGNQCFAALRLANGNTLISTGNGHRVLEVTPAREIAWSLVAEDLPGITLAWITTLQVLPSGNIVLGNCHAGEGQPQIIEITRDKKVVWKFHDFERFGNSLTNSQVLSVNGASITSALGRDR
jgi:outer membrane protein assembly factor BamB